MVNPLSVFITAVDNGQFGTLLDVDAKVGRRAGQRAEVRDLEAAVLLGRATATSTAALVARGRAGDESQNGGTAEHTCESLPQGLEPSSIRWLPCPAPAGLSYLEGHVEPLTVIRSAGTLSHVAVPM